MDTRTYSLADKLMEAILLVAVLATPLLFNPYSARVFEGEKASLLRALTVLAAAAGLVRYLERLAGRRSASSSSSGQPAAGQARGTMLRQHPVTVAALLIALTTILASFVSVTPRLTVWGSYHRGQGLITTLGYLILFFATLSTFNTPERRRRLVTTLLAASVPVTLLAFIQFSGFNPVPLRSLDPSRVSGTLANPIFLGAYLVMVIPLTLAQIARYALAGSLQLGGLIGCAVLLVFQLTAMAFSGSRGPLLGVLAGGLLFLFLLAILSSRRRIAAGLLSIALLGLVALFVISLPNTPLTALNNAPVIGRFVQTTSTGSARVRFLIWQGIVDRFAGEPARLFLGYGPESTQAVVGPAYPPELRHLERERLPDRAHNVVLEALVTTGLVGAASTLFLFAAVFYTGLRALGLVTTVRARSQWLALTAAGVLVGVLLPRLITGNWIYAGLGAVLGLVAGLVVYLLRPLWRPAPGDGSPLSHRSMLVAGILAAAVGYLVEISVGIRVTATESLFWVSAGLLTVLSMTGEEGTVSPREAQTRRESRGAARERGTRSEGITLLWHPEPAALGLLGGFMLSTLSFGLFLLPGARVATSAVGRWTLLVGAWTLAGVLWLAPPDARPRPGTGWIYPLFALAWSGLFLALRSIVPLFGGDALTVLNLYFVWLLLSLASIAALLPHRPRSGDPATGLGQARHPSAEAEASQIWKALAYPVLGAVALGLVAWLAVKPLYADIYLEAAQANAAAGRWSQALAFYQKAATESPDVDMYQQYLGEAFVNAARLTSDPNQREALFQVGQAAFQRAVELNPEEGAHRFNLAHLYLLWSQATPDPARLATLLDQAATLYQAAASRTPLDPRVLVEWGQVLQLQGDVDGAMAKYRAAVALDPQAGQAYLQMGLLYHQLLDTEQALQMYQQAIRVEPDRVEAYRALADLYRAEGRLVEAVAAQQRAAELRPTDYTIHQNLALLYRDLGQIQNAVAEARLALTFAPPEQQQALQGFIQSLLAAASP